MIQLTEYDTLMLKAYSAIIEKLPEKNLLKLIHAFTYVEARSTDEALHMMYVLREYADRYIAELERRKNDNE